VFTLVEEVPVLLRKGWWEGGRVLESPEISFKILDMQLVFKEMGVVNGSFGKARGIKFLHGTYFVGGPIDHKTPPRTLYKSSDNDPFFPIFHPLMHA
jgi:hypothetical protein